MKRWLGLLLLGAWIGGSGVARADIVATNTPLDFGATLLTQSPMRTETLRSTGGTAATVTVVLSADVDCSQFRIVSLSAPDVGPGVDQTVVIQFMPDTPGSRTCTIDVNDDQGTLLTSFVVAGQALAPQIAVDPNALSFGHVEVNTQSATKPVTATNNGDTTLTISSAVLTPGSGDYVIVNRPSDLTLVHGQSATWDIACKPLARDASSGTFEIVSDSFNNKTFDVALDCTGDQAALQLTPTSVSFGLVQRGTSLPVPFTLKNTGNVTLNLSSALAPAVKGYAFDLASLPATLDPGIAIPLTVTFAPALNTDGGSAALTFTGTSDTTRATSTPLSLSGTSASVSVTPTPLDVGTFRFDSTSSPVKTYQITNDGGATISIASANFTAVAPTANADFHFVIKRGTATVTLPQTLTIGQQLDVTVTAGPVTHTGLLSGHVDVVTNITGAAPVVQLTATSTAAVVNAPTTVDFGDVDVDATTAPTRIVTIENTGDATLNYSIAPLAGSSATFTYAGLPNGATTLAAHTSINITVTYKPTIDRAPGNFDAATLVAHLTGVLGGPSDAMVSLKGHPIDRHILLSPAPTFPPTYRNPGDKAPLRTVTISNLGEAPLHVTAVMLGGDGAFQLMTTTPVDLPHLNDTADFVVKFSPTTVASANATLTFMNNDNGQPMAMVSLSGLCMDRMISFGPPTINLGLTAVGIALSTDALTVTNMNMADGFMIRAITLDDESVFHVDGPSGNAMLMPSGTQRFKITFDPKSIDHFETLAHLRIDQDPSDEGMVVKISGDSVFAEAHGSGGCNAGGAGPGGALALGLALAVLVRGRRRRSPAVVLSAAAAAMLALAPAAHSDGIGISVFEPTPATTGAGFALQAPDVGADGSWVMNAVASYAADPLVLESRTATGGSAASSALVARSTLMQLGVAYALLGRFELGAHLPFYQQSGDDGPFSKAASGTATGNLALHAKARLWRGGLGGGTLVAGASATVVIPTATAGQFTGSDQMEERFLVLGSFTPAALGSRLALSVNAGPMLRGTSQYANLAQKNGVAWGVGASFRVLDELWATAELFGESTPSSQSQEPTTGAMPPATTLSPIEALAGLSVKPRPWFTLGLAVGRGVTSAAGTPSLRGVLSLSLVPGAAAQPPIHVAEPARPDGDADGDGIPDSLDKCPNEPEDKDMFEDQDGCPDPDNDHDGIPDAVDKCPLDPEDKDGFQDEDGCPDPDNDHDGIPDAIDKCPNEPEDKDGFEDLDGCPDPDNDHDGIPDDKDKCPNQPETINGFQDDDGCPDKGDSTIVLSPDRIETLDPIQFSGVKLVKADNPLLGQVGATLRAHTEIVRVRVTVHVQPTSDADADQARSDKRAQAVRDWLVQWGIAPARLEARGFGGTKPLVPAEQRGAAKINDRLELIILERK